jgi:hypothetical protein
VLQEPVLARAGDRFVLRMARAVHHRGVGGSLPPRAGRRLGAPEPAVSR